MDNIYNQSGAYFGKVDYKGNMWWGHCPPVYAALQDTVDYDVKPYINLWYGVLEFKACKHRMFAGYNSWKWPETCPECAGETRTTAIIPAHNIKVEKTEEGQVEMIHAEAFGVRPIPVHLIESVSVDEIMVKVEDDADQQNQMEYDEYYDATELDSEVTMDEKDDGFLPVPVCYPPQMDSAEIVSGLLDNIMASDAVQDKLRAYKEQCRIIHEQCLYMQEHAPQGFY